MKALPDILILYNTPARQASDTRGTESEAGILVEVKAVEDSLKRLGAAHRTVSARSISEAADLLAASPEPVVFNLVEEFPEGPADTVYVPALCRSLRKEVTGCDTPCLLLTTDKWQAKSVLAAAGIGVPRAVLVSPSEKTGARLPFRGPYLVKPVSSDASEGIWPDSVFSTQGRRLNAAVRRIHLQFQQAALIEQLVGSRELNVAIIERHGKPVLLPVSEISFKSFPKGKARIVDYAAKWIQDSFECVNTPRIIPAPLSEAALNAAQTAALQAWHSLGCRDYARVDLRMTANRVWVLETNPNPDISPRDGFVAALDAAGIPFDRFVRDVVEHAARRLHSLGHGSASRAGRSSASRKSAAGRIRPIRPTDLSDILSFLKDTASFRPGELSVAEEVLGESLKQGAGLHYRSYVMVKDGHPVGWVCWGRTPCTVGTYDLYWIAVDRAHQKKGTGTALIEYAEKQMSLQGGRMIVVETSGQALYHLAQRFYARHGYSEAARVRDFYAQGDDKVVYVKRIGT